jgi:hypothetical protein
LFLGTPSSRLDLSRITAHPHGPSATLATAEIAQILGASGSILSFGLKIKKSVKLPGAKTGDPISAKCVGGKLKVSVQAKFEDGTKAETEILRARTAKGRQRTWDASTPRPPWLLLRSRRPRGRCARRASAPSHGGGGGRLQAHLFLAGANIEAGRGRSDPIGFGSPPNLRGPGPPVRADERSPPALVSASRPNRPPHPLRAEALEALERIGEPLSPRLLHEVLDRRADLPTVAYHLARLGEDGHLVGRRAWAPGGAIECVYALPG